MILKCDNLKFQNLVFWKKSCLIWLNLIKRFYEKKKNKNIIEDKIFYISKNFKEIGNYLFKQNNYQLAKNLYTVSLVVIPKNKIIERSLNFSNRAQCLIFLDYKPLSQIECISALKLKSRHDKSWYRKIFVSKGFKDYISCLKIVINVQSLSIKFVRNHTCIQSEVYGRNIMRLGNVSFKKKRGGFYFRIKIKNSLEMNKNTLKIKKSLLVIILIVIKEIHTIIKWVLSYFFNKNILYLFFFLKYRPTWVLIMEIVLGFRNKSYGFRKKLVSLAFFSKSLLYHLIFFKINKLS